MPFKASLDEYYEAANEGITDFLPSHEVKRVSKIDVGGIPAVLDEATIDSSDIDPLLSGIYGQTTLTLLQGKTAWIVTCEFPIESEYSKSCESVVRTLRILE